VITSLKLTNFMRHERLDVTFGPGLQVIRGANEGGKSSLLMGMAYALFGAKVLRTTFAEAVTWGRPESSLKVVLDLDVGGRHLTVSRSKGSAEVVENGHPIVTGQSEVSNYMAGLVGADAQAAAKLMLANQGNLRGSLEQGPKATAQMIESLADFELFERLVDAMTTKLVLGNTEAAETALAAATALDQSMPSPVSPDVVKMQAEADRLSALRDGAEAESSRLYQAVMKAEDVRKAASDRLTALDGLQKRLAEARHVGQELDAQAYALAEQSQCDVTPEGLEAQREAIAAAKKWAEVHEAFTRFSALTYPTVFWEGSYDEFDNERRAAAALVKETESNAAEISSDIKVLRGTLVTSAFCGYCGQDFSMLPSVAQKNAETQASIDRMLSARASIDVDLVAARKYSAHLEDLDRTAGDFNGKALGLNGLISFDKGFWPPRISWTGPEQTSEAPDLPALAAQLADMETRLKAADAAKAKLGLIEVQLAAQALKVQGLKSSLVDYTDATPDLVAAAEAAKAAAHEAWHNSYQTFSTASIAHSDIVRLKDQAVKDYETAVEAKAKAQADAEAALQHLETMRFNNGLMKKVRQARPIIADKLWNTVLTAVSTMFTRMRGETSVVTKDNGGFKVNGQAVESLSGSTLDLLGLAIRTALIKTFIPHCPFLVLDEPAAAMDVDRTAALLGFVHATGFSQVILVTHDSLAESVADNVVQL